MESWRRVSNFAVTAPPQWRVPGSSVDTGSHRKFHEEDSKIKIKPRIKVSVDEESLRTREIEGPQYLQSFGRDSDDEKIKEKDQHYDLEEKFLPSPQVPSGLLADLAARCDSPNEI